MKWPTPIQGIPHPWECEVFRNVGSCRRNGRLSKEFLQCKECRDAGSCRRNGRQSWGIPHPSRCKVCRLPLTKWPPTPMTSTLQIHITASVRYVESTRDAGSCRRNGHRCRWQCSFLLYVGNNLKSQWTSPLTKQDKNVNFLFRTAYRCEKEPTGELNRDSLINCINEIALNTPDK